MSLVKLTIKGISYSQTQNGAYALILNEVDGDRKLPIVIGAFEAQSIAIALEKEIKPPRPLTHDLFKNFADRFDIVVKQVIIHKLVDGVFYSSIICERDKISSTAGVTWIDNHGQVRLRLEYRNGRDVESVASCSLISANPPLAENDVAISLCHDVLRCHEKLGNAR